MKTSPYSNSPVTLPVPVLTKGAIINSSIGKDLLPSLYYTNNDFDSLFDDEEKQIIDNIKNSCDNDDDDNVNNRRTSYSQSFHLEGTFQPTAFTDDHYQEITSTSTSNSASIGGTCSSTSLKKHDDLQALILHSLLKQESKKQFIQEAVAALYLKQQTNNKLYSASLDEVQRMGQKKNQQFSSTSSSCLQESVHQQQQPQHQSFHQEHPQQTDNCFVTTPLMSQLFHQAKLNNMHNEIDESTCTRVDSSTDTSTCDIVCKRNHEQVPSTDEERNKRRKKWHNNNDADISFFNHDSASHRHRHRHQYVKVVASKLPMKQCNSKTQIYSTNSPIVTYMKLLKSHSCQLPCRFRSLSRYYSTPSKLQKASFGNSIIKAVQNRNCKTLKELVSSGLSPNPSNQFGDSILNSVCKRGHGDVFKTLMECGASIHTCDQFGRTPLHHICWSSTPCFSIVEKILSIELDMLHAEDKDGRTPMDYISCNDKNWTNWSKFLMEKEDILFRPMKEGMRGYDKQNGENNVNDDVDTITLNHNYRHHYHHHEGNQTIIPVQRRISSCLPDPINALSENKAYLISSGQEEVIIVD